MKIILVYSEDHTGPITHCGGKTREYFNATTGAELCRINVCAGVVKNVTLDFR
jgi:hypothetical protein